jgi:hypothetical protein
MRGVCVSGNYANAWEGLSRQADKPCVASEVAPCDAPASVAFLPSSLRFQGTRPLSLSPVQEHCYA